MFPYLVVYFILNFAITSMLFVCCIRNDVRVLDNLYLDEIFRIFRHSIAKVLFDVLL